MEELERELEQEELNKKKFIKGVLCGALAMFVAMAVIGFAGYKLIGHSRGTDANAEILGTATEDKLGQIRELLDKYYLYDIDDDELQTGIYEGFVSGVDDPYTVYYDEEATKDLLESSSGEFYGIGVGISLDTSTGYLTVLQVYEGSPAEEAGLEVGDVIYKVDDREIDGEDLSEVVSWIRGEEGSQVRLGIYRGEDAKEMEFTATRAKIEMHTVEHEMKENQIGYIRVTEFDTVTYDQFKTALTDLQDQGMKGLVIDLRSNPGGNVATVCDMMRLLLPKGVMVYTEDKDGNRTDYTNDSDSGFDLPLTVLVDGYSASASEIFTGAIQDYGIGQVVGTTTYGKGVVQQLLDLKDGTYLKVTISEYFTPNGRSINKKGIDPDVEIEYEVNEEDENADNQLDKALEIVQGELQ
ncbi:MAG: S41 family peptidase [Hespellia sp.]|nr:S41 family peptidase [Hespellia sp.]